MKTRSVVSTARTSACASSSERAIGFSSRTCLPAASAASATSRCCGVGRQISTASMPGSARTACRSSVQPRVDLARQGLAPIGTRRVDRRHLDVRHRGVRFGVRAPHEPRAQDRDPDHVLSPYRDRRPTTREPRCGLRPLPRGLGDDSRRSPISTLSLFRNELPHVAKRLGHGPVDLFQGGPGLALEFDLDRAGTIEPGVVEHLEEGRESRPHRCRPAGKFQTPTPPI